MEIRSDHDIVTLANLRQWDAAIRGFQKLYGHKFYQIENRVRALGGTPDDAGDALQAGLVGLFKLLREGRYEDRGYSLFTFVFRAAQNHAITLFNRRRHTEDLDKLQEKPAAEPENEFLEARKERAHWCLDRIGEPCAGQLRDIFWEGFSMREIAVKYGYKTEAVAKQMVFKCRNRFRELWQQHFGP